MLRMLESANRKLIVVHPVVHMQFREMVEAIHYNQNSR